MHSAAVAELSNSDASLHMYSPPLCGSSVFISLFAVPCVFSQLQLWLALDTISKSNYLTRVVLEFKAEHPFAALFHCPTWLT
jgi:hypothetical protein